MSGLYAVMVHMQKSTWSGAASSYSTAPLTSVYNATASSSSLPIIPLFWESFVPEHSNQGHNSLNDDDDLMLENDAADSGTATSRNSPDDFSQSFTDRLSLHSSGTTPQFNQSFRSAAEQLSFDAHRRGGHSSLLVSDTASIASGGRAGSVLSVESPSKFDQSTVGGQSKSVKMQENIEKGIDLPPAIGSCQTDGSDCPWLPFMLEVHKQVIFLRETRSWSVDPLMGKEAYYGAFYCTLQLRCTAPSLESNDTQEKANLPGSPSVLSDFMSTTSKDQPQSLRSVEAQVVWLYRAPLYYSVMASRDLNPATARAHVRKLADRLQAVFKVNEQPAEFRYRADKIRWVLTHTLRCANVKLWNPRVDLAVDKEMESLKAFLKT